MLLYYRTYPYADTLGHLAAVCESPRLGQIHPVDTLELTVDDAWTMLEEADKAKDLETFKLVSRR